jgi:hypothetical protein
MYPARAALQFLRVVAGIGFLLSLAGLGVSLWVTAECFFPPPGQPGFPLTPRGVIVQVLYAFREPGMPLLLSGILFVLCEIALSSTHRSLKPEREPEPSP